MAAKFDDHDGRLRGRKAQARRLRLWTKDPCCAKCRKLTDYPDGFQADHIVPLFKDGEDDEKNMQVLCLECHNTKTNDDLGRASKVQIGEDGWPVG